MNCFNDKTGKQWTLDLNVGTARRVKAECGVDLVNVLTVSEEGGIDTTILQKLSDDAYLLVGVLFSLCRQQVEKEGLDENGFAERFDSETIVNAVDSLIQEIINFSPPAKRKMLMLIYQKTQSFRAKAEQHLNEMLNSKEFEEEIDQQLNKLLTNTQESSE